MIDYVVCYYFQDEDGKGHGNVDLKMSMPPQSVTDIREIEKQITDKHGIKNVVVTNLIRLGGK